MLKELEHLICNGLQYGNERDSLVKVIGLPTDMVTIGDVLVPWRKSQLAQQATSALTFLTASNLVYVLYSVGFFKDVAS